MKEYINKLQQRYNYDENIVNALSIIIPNMVSYYGEEYENTILEAIYNCQIHICKKDENIFDVVDRYSKVKKEGNVKVNEGELKVSSGVYHSEPILKYNETKKEYEIININRIIVLNNNRELTDKSGIATLTHELCHLIKGYVNEYSIEGNTIIAKNGLIREVGIIKDNNTIEVVSEKNVGLEEGINSYDEAMIVSKIYNEEYEPKGYVALRESAKIMIEKLQLKNEVIECLLNKKDILQEKYNNNSNKDLFGELNVLLDTYVAKEYERLKSAFDHEKIERINLELQELVKQIVTNFGEYKNNNIQIQRSV